MQVPNRERHARSRAGRARAGVFVAVVHAADGLRLAAAAESRDELVRRLAEYARRRAPHTLRAEHARHVRELLARRELEAAVEVYFGLVGERWDAEWLVTAALARDVWWDVDASVDAVARTTDGTTRSREA
jgi:hypothetical protein